MVRGATSATLAETSLIDEDLGRLPLRDGDRVIAEVTMANGQTGYILGTFHSTKVDTIVLASGNRDEPGEVIRGEQMGLVTVDKEVFDQVHSGHVELALARRIKTPIKLIKMTEETIATRRAHEILRLSRIQPQPMIQPEA